MAKTLLMGVVNLTPDSFFDGGVYSDVAQARAHALKMVEQGADWIDVGGESSRPGAAPISAAEEQRRVLPLLESLGDIGAGISIDTYRASTAEKALDAGATMINDITGLRHDPKMAEVVASSGCLCVLMHMQGTPETMQENPQYVDVVDDVCAFFEQRLEELTAQGVDEAQIWLDPGFGFGKSVADNLSLLRHLDQFQRFGRPVLIGTSNKSTIGAVLEAPLTEREEGTAATVALAIAQGVQCVRVHNVLAMARVAKMSDAILGR